MVVELNILIIGIIILITTIFLILKIEWFIKEIREICKDFSGFIKFSQMIFMFSSWFILISLFLYYLIFNPQKEVPILEIFLTIIVGFLGTMIGLFFSNDSLNELKTKYKSRGERMLKDKNKLLEIKTNLEKKLKKIKN